MIDHSRLSEGVRTWLRRPDDEPAIETGTESADPTDQTLPRRQFLGAMATAGGGVQALQAGGNQTGGDQTEGGQTVETHFRFDGRVEAWIGRAPSAIGGAENPTLNLQSGTQYRVTWVNADGQPHDFTIQDANGNDITSTEVMSDEGQSLSLTFTATEEMAQYICTIHPNSMVGDISVGDGGDGDDNGGNGDGGDGGETETGLGPVEAVGIMGAATVGAVAGLSLALIRYFDEYDEP